MDFPPTRIVVELTSDAAPIAGCVLAPAQDSRPFTGWIGLFAALRAAAGEGISANSLDGGDAGQVSHDEASRAHASRGGGERGGNQG
jgi:hypothetical protein